MKNDSLKLLIDKNDWTSVEESLLEFYPEQIKSISKYKSVFEKLKSLEPKESNVKLFIKKSSARKTKELPSIHGESPDEKHDLSLEFLSWDKWLGLSLSANTLLKINEPEIIAHCLFEMTYAGFSEEEIQRQYQTIQSVDDDDE